MNCAAHRDSMAAMRYVVCCCLLLAACSPSPAPPATPAPAAPSAPVGLSFKSKRIGRDIAAKERPMLSHVSIADLDGDGMQDVLVCDTVDNHVSCIRQSPRGQFTEMRLGQRILAPAHAQSVDFDGDGDMDVLVASLGVLFPNNAKIGSIVLLQNDGQMNFTNVVLIDRVARVADVRAGDLDGDGDLDLVAAQFGYDDGETRWMENLGDGKFKSHILQQLSGVINAVPVDMDGDGDLDIATLVSQEWEELYVFVNDGQGAFAPTLIWGSTNEDFGSSWITPADLDGDGDIDILYSNGDAMDYNPPIGRPWHGVQWLENTGAMKFKMHRIASYSGASSPQPADLDGDGDLDIAVVSAYNDWTKPGAYSLIYLENDGTMQFTRHNLADTPTHLISVAAGDLDDDGRADLVTGALHLGPPFDRLSRVLWWTRR